VIGWGREVCGDLPTAERREWLCVNGIGGFASGTVAGSLTRRDHGLLVAALDPPLGLKILVNYRDYHSTTHGEGWRMDVATVTHGLRVVAFEGARPLLLLTDRGEARQRPHLVPELRASSRARTRPRRGRGPPARGDVSTA